MGRGAEWFLIKHFFVHVEMHNSKNKSEFTVKKFWVKVIPLSFLVTSEEDW